jgi:L-ascorbate metabolism protein UlaG (beta-lactamase superfamily)
MEDPNVFSVDWTLLSSAILSGEMQMNESTVTLTLIGGPTVLIETGGLRLLTDPTFDPPGSYQSGPLTLQKKAGPALSVAEIGHVDAVLLSHDQHADNLDPAGRALIGEIPTVLTTRIGAERLGGTTRGLSPWDTIEIKDPGGAKLNVTATPARHGPVGIEPMTGDVIGFLLGIDNPGDLIYVTGDTVGCVEHRTKDALNIPNVFTDADRRAGLELDIGRA